VGEDERATAATRIAGDSSADGGATEATLTATAGEAPTAGAATGIAGAAGTGEDCVRKLAGGGAMTGGGAIAGRDCAVTPNSCRMSWLIISELSCPQFWQTN